MKSLSIIIPAHNEEDKIESTVLDFLNFYKNVPALQIIIVISNNCTDSTPRIAKDISLKEKKVSMYIQPGKGKGDALILGFQKATKEFIGFVDADGSVSPKEFDKVLKAAEITDCAIGSRAVKGSHLEVRQPLYRIFLGYSLSYLKLILFGLSLKDTQCGAKIFRKRAIKDVLPDLGLKGFEIDIEILWNLKKKGYSISEVGIAWKDARNSKVGALSPIKMFIGLLKLRIRNI